MFNVLVSANGEAWEDPDNMYMDASRFGEHSGSEIEQISLNDHKSLGRLEAVPAILMYETGVDGPSADVVRIGHLRDIRATGGQIVFRFEERARMPRSVAIDLGGWIGLGRYEQNRTHWAVKDGDIGKVFLDRAESSTLKYEVTLSFAGEQREFVRRVAEHLKTAGVRVFYDEFAEAELWGKNLTEFFDRIYRKDARFCIMFVSREYAQKMWTRHERRSAIARAMQEREEYILPVRFDGTDIDGLHPTVHYLHADGRTPEAIAEAFLEKIRR